MGYALYIVDLDPLRGDSGTSFLKSRWCSISENTAQARLKQEQYFAKEHSFFSPSGNTIRKRQQEILDYLCEINPLCILDISDEFSILSYYYAKGYPTLYLPIRIQDCSSSFFHKIAVVADPDDQVMASHPVKQEQVLQVPHTRGAVQPRKKHFRKDYGFTDEDIVVVTVGNRLPFEISPDLIEQMCGLMEPGYTVKWLCVGCTDLPQIRGAY